MDYKTLIKEAEAEVMVAEAEVIARKSKLYQLQYIQFLDDKQMVDVKVLQEYMRHLEEEISFLLWDLPPKVYREKPFQDEMKACSVNSKDKDSIRFHGICLITKIAYDKIFYQDE